MIKKISKKVDRKLNKFFCTKVINSSDPWKTLGLKERYSKQELKEAYIRLVKEYHPDKNPKNLAIFMEI